MQKPQPSRVFHDHDQLREIVVRAIWDATNTLPWEVASLTERAHAYLQAESAIIAIKFANPALWSKEDDDKLRARVNTAVTPATRKEREAFCAIRDLAEEALAAMPIEE